MNDNKHQAHRPHGLRKAAAALLLLLTLLPAAANAKQQDVFVFGVAASFNDSTVYITDIQELKGAYIQDGREKFLVERDEYSYQLRNHFAGQGKPNRTCITFWATTRKDIEKKYQKVMAKYSNTSGKKKKKKTHGNGSPYRVQHVDQATFAYTVVTPTESYTVEKEEKPAPAKGGRPTPPSGGQPPMGGGQPPMGGGQMPH